MTLATTTTTGSTGRYGGNSSLELCVTCMCTSICDSLLLFAYVYTRIMCTHVQRSSCKPT